MAKQSYWELLKHPQWQKKRLQVLEAHGFCCDICGCDDSCLHVHHGCYERDTKPWDYHDLSLHVLCEPCHYVIQEAMRETHIYLSTIAHLDDFEEIKQFIRKVYKKRHETKKAQLNG